MKRSSSRESHLQVKQIIEQSDTPRGRTFDIVIQVLILTSLISFSIETVPDLSKTTRFWLYVVEDLTVGLFTIEYGPRILVADNRLRFIVSFYGLVDLAAILPFYVTTGVDLQSGPAIYHRCREKESRRG